MPTCSRFISGIVLLIALIAATVGWTEDPRVVRPYPFIDQNQNRIYDDLEPQVAAKPGQALDVIVCFDHQPGPADVANLEGLGGTVHEQWRDILFAVHANVPAEALAGLAANEANGVTIIEPNATGHAHLEFSTEQIGVRRVWAGGLWNPGPYDGHSGHRIAILDTGIDDSHPDIPTLAAWVNYADGDASGTDQGEHGTHVAGIAAGRGTQGGTADFKVTYSDIFPQTEGNAWFHYYPINIGASAKVIRATGYWDAAGGQHWLHIRNAGNTTIGSAGCSTTEPRTAVSSALSNVSNDAYRALFGSCTGDGFDTNDTAGYMQVAVPYDSIDGYNLLRGVAPACALVGVKVLNDDGSCGTAQFINGLNWVATNGSTYSIRVANASIGFDGVYSSVDTAANGVVNNGVSFVCSAGNDQGTNYIRSPGTAGKSICVGAVNDENALTNYSSIGNPSDPGSPGGIMKPDVLAPGGSNAYAGPGGTDNRITSVDTNDADICVDYNTSDPNDDVKYVKPDQYSNDYKMMYGTSMAAPHVTGLVALLADARGTWSWANDSSPMFVKNIVCMTTYEVQDAEDGSYTPPLGRATTPKDRREGYGRVDVVAAIQAIDRSIAPFTGTIGDTLGSGHTDQKVMAGNISLTVGEAYDIKLFSDSGNVDADLYIYRGTPDSYGDPVILTSSTTVGADIDEEIIGYTAPSTGTYYVVGKYVSGTSGDFHFEFGPYEEPTATPTQTATETPTATQIPTVTPTTPAATPTATATLPPGISTGIESVYWEELGR
jgi:subtilisin family serine protease